MKINLNFHTKFNVLMLWHKKKKKSFKQHGSSPASWGINPLCDKIKLLKAQFCVSFIVKIFNLILTHIFKWFILKSSMLKECICNLIKQNIPILRKYADLILIATSFKTIILTSRKRYFSYSTEILNSAQEKSLRYCGQMKHYTKMFLHNFSFSTVSYLAFLF